MTMTSDVCSKLVNLQIHIDAPPERVWSALVDEIDAWWLPDFHMVGADSALSLDATAGGALIERRADGSSLLWYTITMVRSGESLHLVGHMAPEWGGPATSMLSLKLEADDTGTLLIVQDALTGAIKDSMGESTEQGWRQLFGDGLKAHVERT
jgi:uncharacterized protein YndB with AHSA1/START domain